MLKKYVTRDFLIPFTKLLTFPYFLSYSTKIISLGIICYADALEMRALARIFWDISPRYQTSNIECRTAMMQVG